jgi:prevent-host-death family protein
MKVVPLAEAKSELSAYVDAAQKDRILVTRHGKPAALLIGVEGEAIEDLLTRADPEFWRMIQERRGERTFSSAEVRASLGLSRAKKGRKPGRRRH